MTTTTRNDSQERWRVEVRVVESCYFLCSGTKEEAEAEAVRRYDNGDDPDDFVASGPSVGEVEQA